MFHSLLLKASQLDPFAFEEKIAVNWICENREHFKYPLIDGARVDNTLQQCKVFPSFRCRLCLYNALHQIKNSVAFVFLYCDHQFIPVS